MSVEVLSVRGLRPACGKVDRDLWLWFLEAKKDYQNYHGPRVTKRMVQNKAMQAFKDAGITGFKASDGWYVRWIKRWHRFECESVDKALDETNEESSGSALSLKKKPSKRNVKKSSKSLHSDASLSDNLPSQEQELFVSSSSSLAIDKMQILHDVASRELADSILQEVNVVGSSSIIYEQPSPILDQISSTEQANGSGLLDFDQITWNDIPYVDRVEFPSNADALYRLDGNNMTYSSSVMSQMMEFAEICHLKEKEMEEHHLQGQVERNALQQTQSESLCSDFQLSQQQVITQHTGGKIFSAMECQSDSNHPFNCSENEYLPDTSFYTMDDNSFPILTHNDSSYVHNNSEYQSGKPCGAEKGNAIIVLDAGFCNQVKLNSLESPRSNLVQSEENMNASLDGHYQPDEVNLIKVNGMSPNISEKVFTNSGRNVDVAISEAYKSDELSIIGLGCLNVGESENGHCADSETIDVVLGSDYQTDQVNIVGYNNLNFDETPGLCTSERSSIGVLYDENYEEDEMSVIKFSNVNITESVNIIGDHNTVVLCGKDNQANEINLAEQNVLKESKKETICSARERSVDTDGSYESDQVNIIELNSLNLGCPRNIIESKESIGIPYSHVFDPNHVDVIEMNHLSQRESRSLCSVDFDGNFHPNQMNAVELGSFHIDERVNLRTEVVIAADYQLNQPAAMELPSLNLGGTSNSCSNEGEIIQEAQIIFRQSLSDEMIHSSSMQASSSTLAPGSPLTLSGHSATGTSSDSSMLLFTQSPFNFSDGAIADVLPTGSLSPVITNLSSSSSSSISINRKTTNAALSCPEKIKLTLSPPRNDFVDVSISAVDIMACRKDRTDIDLDLVDSVILDQVVGMEDQLNQRLKVKTQSSDKATSTDEDGLVKNLTVESVRKPPPRRLGGERYLPCFKKKVLEYAAQHTAKDAAKMFHVHADTLTLWSRSTEPKNTVPQIFPDQQMLTWLKSSRENGFLLNRSQVSCKAKELLKTPGTWQKDKSRWFHVWGSRFAALDYTEETSETANKSNEDQRSSTLPSSFSKALYPDEFKIEVALFAERTTQNLASSVFNIARKRVFEWVAALKAVKKSGDELKHEAPKEETLPQNGAKSHPWSGRFSRKTPPNSDPTFSKLRGRGLGRAVTSVAVDRELWEWFCEQTAKKRKPKSREIRSKAVELFRAHKHERIRCSYGWFQKWSLRHGLSLRYEGDADLLVWCLEQFDHNRNIAHRDLLNQAYRVLTGIHKSDFKASAGWALRFCRRHRSLLSSRPAIDVELPEELEDRIAEFRQHVQQLVRSSGALPDGIGSMDEIPLNFTAGGSGSTRSRLLLRRSGLENCHATVVLSCLADGALLPPAVIFKGLGPPEQVTVDGTPLLVLHQEESCMNSSTMLQWLQHIWLKNISSPSILVLDCFWPHSDDTIKHACETEKCLLTIMPAGCSSKLQPLDVAVTRQFEAIIADRWAKHYASLDRFPTNKRSSSSNNADIIRWVAEAHAQLRTLKKDAICRSFFVTGLSVGPKDIEIDVSDDTSRIAFKF